MHEKKSHTFQEVHVPTHLPTAAPAAFKSIRCPPPSPKVLPCEISRPIEHGTLPLFAITISCLNIDLFIGLSRWSRIRGLGGLITRTEGEHLH